MKTILKHGSTSKVYGGSVKTKFTGKMKTRLRAPQSESIYRITEDDFIRELENGDLRILE